MIMEKSNRRQDIEDILETRADGKLARREGQTLEFKENFNFNGMAEYLRDFAAFANNKGGYLVFGVKDRPRRAVGLKLGSKDQFDKIDPEMITGFLLACFTGHISWEHDVVEIGGKDYGYFYVEEAREKPIICKKDEGAGILRDGDIYFRYGGRTQRIRYSELESIINHRIEKQNDQWVDLVQKIGRSGPANAAILDMEKGRIEKNDAQILVVGNDLVKSVKWIKEGQFDEKEGAPTLKLVGEVTTVDKVEVVKYEKENLLNEYPLTAMELARQVKERGGVKQGDIWRIINENHIKENKDYSCYIFSNKKQEDDYVQNGTVAKGTPSIYKPSAVDLIIRIAKNEH
jgi:hypothetical protein